MESKKTIIQLHSLLKQYGIKNIVFSPGGRHLPLIHSIEKDGYFNTFRVIDERSAAFYALGLIQKTGSPVAVCCTSGTAVINLASAVCEAFYQHLPLLVITGDRMAEYLNQNEDQQYDQIKSFEGFTKYQVRLPRIDSDVDEWYTNRCINEAMIELTHHGNGPVHIDYPIADPFSEIFEEDVIPQVRKIDWNDAETETGKWKQLAARLKDKRVGILWGQSVQHSERLEVAVKGFVEKYDAVILTDYISNCHYAHAINHTPRLIHARRTLQEDEFFLPEVLITIGGNYIFNAEMKGLMRPRNIEHWQVGKEDKVIDGFKKLTTVCEMSEALFFEQMTKNADFTNQLGYYEYWKSRDEEVPQPHSDKFDEMTIISTVLGNMPNDADLQIGNSWSIRMSQMMDIPSSVRQHCNRGVNGIDGSLSTAVGYGATNDRLTYLIIGDLSFFYDMNALWISSLSPKMRILMINNHGGAMLFKPFMKELLEKYPMSNLGLDCKLVTAEGWAKTTGFEYFAVHNDMDLKKAAALLATKNSDKPIFVEAFTDFFEDTDAYLNHTSYDGRSFSDKVVGKLGRFLKK
jgi:2-succinyl-5-enolpyruvyl-6-hydroxy-3-cyclohexene-1-carboxylate synthase